MVISMPVLVEYGYVAILMCLPCFHIVEPQGRYRCLWGKALFVCVGGARWEKACNRLVYLDNFFRQ